MTYTCNFNRLPEVSFFVFSDHLPPEILEKFKTKFPLSAERYLSAVYLLSLSSGKKKIPSLTKNQSQRVHLRLALVEARSIDETLKNEVSQRGSKEKGLGFDNVHSPLLYFIKDLRDISLHDTTLKQSNLPTKLLHWRDNEYDYTISRLVLSNTIGLTKEGRPRWEEEDYKKFLSWYSEAEEKFGAHCVIACGLASYVKYVLQANS